MKNIIAKTIAVTACLLIASAAAFGCGGASASQGQANAPVKAEEQSALPITITAHGNTYAIEDFAITDDENGNTVVSCTTTGFNKLPIKNNRMIIPVYCSAVIDGTEVQFASFATDSESTDFIFDKKIEPDTVVFYPEDDRDDRTEVPV